MKIVHGAVAFAAVSSASLAWARSDPSFEIQQSAFTYTQTTETETADGGDPLETTTSNFESMPSDLEISAKIGHWIFGVAPTEPGASLELTYEFSSKLEAGVMLGYNDKATRTEDLTTTTSSSEFGPRVQYAIDFGDNTIELEGVLAMTGEKSAQKGLDEAGKAVDEEINESGYEIELVTSYGRSLTENLIVAAGVGYTYGVGRENEEGLKLTNGELQVTLLQFRYGIFY